MGVSSQEQLIPNYRFRLGFFVPLLSHKMEANRERLVASDLLQMLVPDANDRAQLHLYSNCSAKQAWDDDQNLCRPVCATPPLPDCHGNQNALQLSKRPSQLSLGGGAFFENEVVLLELTSPWAKLPNYIATGLATCGHDSTWHLRDWRCDEREKVTCPKCRFPKPCEVQPCRSSAGNGLMWKNWQDQHGPVCDTKHGSVSKEVASGAGGAVLGGLPGGLMMARYIASAGCLGPAFGIGSAVGMTVGSVFFGWLASITTQSCAAEPHTSASGYATNLSHLDDIVSSLAYQPKDNLLSVTHMLSKWMR